MRLTTHRGILLASIALLVGAYALASAFAALAGGPPEDPAALAAEWTEGDDPRPALVSRAPLSVGQGEAGTLRLEGRVLDAASQPLAGIRVSLQPGRVERWDDFDPTNGTAEASEPPTPPLPLARETVSRADGSFHFDGLLGDRHYRAAAIVAPPQYATGRWRWIGHTRPLHVTLRVLTGTRELAVRIVDGDGQGRKGWVRFFRAVGADDDPTRSWWVHTARPTDADGRLTVHGAPQEDVFARVWAPGVGVRTSVRIPKDAQGEIALRLGDADGPVIQGRVIDPQGRPIPHARVWATTKATGGSLPFSHGVSAVRAGEDGRYRVGPLVKGPGLRIGADAPGRMARSIKWPSERHAGRGPFTVDLMLVAGGVLKGRVIDEEGRGVAGAQVRASGVSTHGGQYDGDRPRTRADAGGYYRLDGVALGPGIVGAYRNGLSAPLVAHPGPEAVSTHYAGAPFVLEQAGATAKVDIRVRRGVPVSGTVVDEAGRPIADAEIRFRARDNASESVTDVDSDGLVVRSDAEGSFEHPGLPESEWRILAFARGRAGRTQHVTVQRAKPPPPFALTLRPRPVVAGRITGLEGKALEALTVQLRPTNKGAKVSTGVAPDGHFAFDSLWPGSHALSITGGLGVQLAPPVLLDLAWGDVHGSNIFALSGLGSIEVHAIAPDGRPAVGRSIALKVATLVAAPAELNPKREWDGLSATEETDAQGHVQFDGLPAGRYLVFESDSDTEEWRVSAWPGDEDVRLPVPAERDDANSVWLTATITAPDGAPLAFGEAAYGPGSESPTDDPWGNGSVEAFVHAGRLRMRVPADPPYGVLTIRAARDAALRGLDVQPYEASVRVPSTALRIALQAGLHVSGHVLDPDGKPAEGVPIHLSLPEPETLELDDISSGWTPQDSDSTTLRSGPGGRFDIPSLAPGNVLLRLQGHRGQLGTLPEAVEVGRSDVVLQQRRGASIAGLVLDPHGRPAGNTLVRYEYLHAPDPRDPDHTAWRSAAAQTDADGRFRIGGLEPNADGLLTAAPPSEAPDTWIKSEVDGIRAGTTGVTIRLLQGVRARVRVLRPDGQPCEAVSVWYVRDDDWNEAKETGTSGTFHFGPVQPGRYRILASPTTPDDTLPALAEHLDTTISVELPTADIRITLRANHVLRGHIHDPGASAWQVHVLDKEGKRVVERATKVWKDGSFAVAASPNERLALVASAPDAARYGRLDGARAGSTGNTIRLVPAMSLSGTVRGLPADAGALLLHAQGRLGLDFQAPLDERGRFRLDGLPPGAYSLHLVTNLPGHLEDAGPFEAGSVLTLDYVNK